MNEEEEKERQTPKKKGTSTPKGSPKTSPPREDKKKKDKKREKRGHKRSRTRRDDEDEDEEEEDQPVKTPGSVVQVRCSCFLRSALVFALPLHLLLIVRLGQRCRCCGVSLCLPFSGDGWFSLHHYSVSSILLSLLHCCLTIIVLICGICITFLLPHGCSPHHGFVCPEFFSVELIVRFLDHSSLSPSLCSLCISVVLPSFFP